MSVAGDDEERNPAEQLLELLVYAPIGLLYEYEDVLPTLIKRGKSQVQLARVLGQFAANRGKSEADNVAGDAATLLGTVVAKAVTELGTLVGLAPDLSDDEAPRSDEDGAATTESQPAKSSAAGTASEDAGDQPLPIVGYDGLTAREIIPLLGDLSLAQREQIRHHEIANRGRKTIIAKLDRLAN